MLRRKIRYSAPQREPSVYPADLLPLLQSRFTALADLDVRHDQEIEEIQKGTMDPQLKEKTIRMLEQRHDQRRAPYVRQLAMLEGRIRTLLDHCEQSGSGTPRCPAVYNLFCRREEPCLHCAVPEDRPIPGFIDQEGWRFCGTLDESAETPSGFHPRAAATGVRFNGFYLFHVLNQ